METIPKTECEKIGYFRKTHGVHGEVVLEFEEHFEYSVEEAERFFVELEGLLVPFFISEEGLRFRSAKSAIVDLDGVDSDTYAQRLVGNSVYIYKNEIVDEPEESNLSYNGYVLYDKIRGKIGIVESTDDYSGNVVLTLFFQGEEVLVPFNEEMLIEINEQEKKLIMNLPEGLLDQ